MKGTNKMFRSTRQLGATSPERLQVTAVGGKELFLNYASKLRRTLGGRVLPVGEAVGRGASLGVKLPMLPAWVSAHWPPIFQTVWRYATVDIQSAQGDVVVPSSLRYSSPHRCCLFCEAGN